MGLGKTIRKWLGAADAKSITPLGEQLAETRRRLKEAESLIKTADKRIVDLEEKLAVIGKHLEFADASGTIEAYGWIAEASPGESQSQLAAAVADYLKARALPTRAVFPGEGGEAFAAALGQTIPGLEIAEASSEGPFGICHLGDLSAEAFGDAIRTLVAGNRLADGALLRVASVRHAGLLNPLMAESTAGAPVQWMPWRLTRSDGAWLIIWRDGDST
jgi:hypothetical protein